VNAIRLGAPPGEARAAVVLVHGRGGSPEDMLGLAAALARAPDRPDGLDGIAWLALRAPGRTWYPFGFMEPMERNQPDLDRSLAAVGTAVEALEADGIPVDRIVLAGFSQGACLSLEHAARNPRRYGGLVGLSGGLIGPPGTPRDYEGSLADTPVFLGCSDRDPHIPESRVRETGEVLAGLEGRVTTRIYPGMGHTVNEDEIAQMTKILTELT
jgi:predicted esterase